MKDMMDEVREVVERHTPAIINQYKRTIYELEQQLNKVIEENNTLRKSLLEYTNTVGVCLEYQSYQGGCQLPKGHTGNCRLFGYVEGFTPFRRGTSHEI